MSDDRHVIWSNWGLDYEDWKADLEENYPDLSENERIALMYEINNDYLDDERANLNVQLSQPILVIGDLGFWHGRRMGYKEIDSGNIRDCLFPTPITAHGMWISWAICAATRSITTARTTIFTAPTRTACGNPKSSC